MPEEKRSIHKIFSDWIIPWARNEKTPDIPFEGCIPEFTRVFGLTTEEFSYDSFIVQNQPQEGWTLGKIEFPEYFDGWFSFYLPKEWGKITREGSHAVVGTNERIYQSIFLMKTGSWAESMKDFLEKNEVISFAYYPLWRDKYQQWLFVTHPEKDGAFWLWHVNGTRDYIILQKGDASDKPTLVMQLTSLLNSLPWWGWIEAGRKKLGD
ncbi:MAG: hypothetical protein JXB14_01855 [Candidatus Altiarchaeota archaeon]|nr:hypothetical protein [Candidatus Altiarchaeota archaeon]